MLGHLEDAAARMQRAALYIQSTWRMARCRRAFLAARAAAVTVQAHWRGLQGRRLFAELLRQHRAAVRIQAAARGCAQRRRYRRALAGVVAIQVGLPASWADAGGCCGMAGEWRSGPAVHASSNTLNDRVQSQLRRLPLPPIPTDGLAAACGTGARGGAPG